MSSEDNSKLSESRRRESYGYAREGMFLFDGQTHKITASDGSLFKFFGYAKEEFPGRELRETGLFADEESSGAFFRELEKKPFVRFEKISFRTKDGDLREVELIGGITNENNNKQIKCRIRDLTEITKSDVTLHWGKDFFSSFYNNATDEFFLLAVEADECYRYLSVNETFCKVTGLAENEIVGRRVEDILPERAHRLFFEKCRQAVETGKVVNWEETAIYPAGDRINEVLVTPICNSDSDCLLLLGMVHGISARKKDEIRIKNSEQFSRGLFENSPDCIKLLSLDGTLLLMNANGLCLMEIDDFGVFAGKDWADFWEGNENLLARQAIEEARAGKTGHFQGFCKTAKGKLKYWDVSVAPIFDAEQKPSLIISISRDITDRKRFDEEKDLLVTQIEYQHERLNNIIENVSGIVWEAWGNPIAASQRVNFISDYVETMLGYSVEEWLSTPNFWLTIVHPEDKERISREVAEKFSWGGNFSIQFRWLSKDGRVVWVESRTKVICDKTGQPIGVRGISLDITSRKQMEDDQKRLTEELAVEKTRLQHIFEYSPSFIVVLRGENFVFETANPAYYRLVGDRHLIGLPAGEALPELMSQGLLEKLLHVYNTGEPFTGIEVPIKLQPLNGSEPREYYVDFVYMPLRESDNSISGVISYGMDVTEQVLTKTKIQESEERYRYLFESNPLPMWFVDVETQKFLAVNHAAIEYYGYSRDEFLNMVFSDILFLGETPESKHAEKSEFSNSGEARVHRHRKKDGSLIFVDIFSNRLRFNGKEAELVLANDVTERRKAEESIRFQAHLLNTVEQAVIATDLNGIVIYWNEYAQKLYGWRAEEVINRSILEVTAFNPSQEQMEEIMSNLRQGKGWTGEFILQNRSGAQFPATITNSPVYDDKGELVGIVGISNDITERKQAEQAVVEANERAIREYEKLLDRIAELAHSLGTARDLVTVYRALYSFTIASVPCTGFFVSLYDEEKHLRYPGYALSDGTEVDVSELPPMGMTGSPNSRAVSTGTIIIENDYQAAMSGKPVINIGEDDFPDLPQSCLAAPMAVMGRIVGAVEVQSNLLGAYTKEHATAMRMAANLAANAIENVRLIEKEHEKTEQLRQSQQLESVGRLAGGIAHDFNNMLTAINGYSDLIIRQLEQDNPIRSSVEEIKKAGARSADLTRQLLAFSRRQILQPVVVQINEIIGETIKMLQRLIGEDIQLTTTLNPKVGRVKVDPGQFTQIVMNLAVNARDAMPQGGKLTLETSNVFLDSDYTNRHIGVLPGAYVMFAVSDTGSGMSEETREHIFEPFFTTKEVGQGTGLGLATVYGIVKQSGGTIDVYSEQGYGTTFNVYLPRVAEAPVEEKPEVISVEWSKGTETIFLIEDEDIVRHLTRQILEECGYKVIEARNGVDALRIYDETNFEFDLLLTDVVMPEIGGRELAEKLAGRRKDFPVLFTSGYTDDAVVRHGIIQVNTNFIQKPFAPEALVGKIREILDKARKA